ncbi:hypothetical protein [Dactylosporangium salmoneum]|uniref:Uncharacterized protein n=1 Tax=Dactylosporangium salmoneum TaxID=53361 RepID=A0ABP5U8H6_9ACTN
MPVLLIARLTVRGSYVRDLELPADGTFDTVQFFLPDDGPVVYRVRTFAFDHDIHVQGLGRQPVEALRAHLDRTVGDVLAGVDEVALPTMGRPDLVAAGIGEGDLEVAPEARFAFWNPDGGRYATRAAPIAPEERDGLREVVYLGGIARFWLPGTWESEQDPRSGGCFYDPDGEGTLRLSVLTFDTSAATGPPVLRPPRKPGERQIDGGTLPTGCEFDGYEISAVEDGEDLRIRYWQIAQELPGQCRVYVFSYTYPAAAGADLAGELALLDRELRRMIPYPDPV